MYIFPTNEPLSCSAREGNTMKPLVLFCVCVRVSVHVATQDSRGALGGNGSLLGREAMPPARNALSITPFQGIPEEGCRGAGKSFGVSVGGNTEEHVWKFGGWMMLPGTYRQSRGGMRVTDFSIIFLAVKIQGLRELKGPVKPVEWENCLCSLLSENRQNFREVFAFSETSCGYEDGWALWSIWERL